MTKLFPLALLLVTLSSCVKDDLEVADLNTNPFDPAYVGAPIFEVVSSGITTESIGGVPQTYLRVEVRTRTDRFLTPTPFQLRYKRSTDATWSGFDYNTPTTVLKRFDYAEGEQYCWQFQLANDGSIGTGNTICVTAE